MAQQRARIDWLETGRQDDAGADVAADAGMQAGAGTAPVTRWTVTAPASATSPAGR